MIPTLDTARLRLVAPAETHVDAMFAMYGDLENTRLIPHARVTSRSGAWMKIATQLGHWQLRGFGFWMVVDRASGEVVGNAGLMFPVDNPALEIGWLIDRRHWRKGYALETTRAILVHAFDVLRADSVLAHIAPDNVASIALATKLGMTRDEAASDAEATIMIARSLPTREASY